MEKRIVVTGMGVNCAAGKNIIVAQLSRQKSEIFIMNRYG